MISVVSLNHPTNNLSKTHQIIFMDKLVLLSKINVLTRTFAAEFNKIMNESTVKCNVCSSYKLIQPQKASSSMDDIFYKNNCCNNKTEIGIIEGDIYNDRRD
jgi:hypothetical protein